MNLFFCVAIWDLLPENQHTHFSFVYRCQFQLTSMVYPLNGYILNRALLKWAKLYSPHRDLISLFDGVAFCDTPKLEQLR